MKFWEYGADRKNTILLLHGGGLSWWNYRDVAEILQGEYHIILPILDGHAGSDRPFTTIEENAEDQSLHIKPDLFEDYYRDTCQIKKQDMIAFLKANTAYTLKDSLKDSLAVIHVYVGEREKREILRSAESICRMNSSCKLHRMNGFRHGEFSINHADQYANAIRQIVKR